MHEASNPDNVVAGASSQGKAPCKSIGDGRIWRETSDSFYDSMMELPVLDDLGTGSVTSS